METRNETIHEQGKLKRKLGLGAALAVAVGTTIGSGISRRWRKWLVHPVLR